MHFVGIVHVSSQHGTRYLVDGDTGGKGKAGSQGPQQSKLLSMAHKAFQPVQCAALECSISSWSGWVNLRHVFAVLCMQEHGDLLSLQLMRSFVVLLQVWLAKHEDDGSLVQTPQGTEGLVGINCLTKIQVFLHQSLHLENHLNSLLRYSGGRV